jgi:hypothetical protein
MLTMVDVRLVGLIGARGPSFDKLRMRFAGVATSTDLILSSSKDEATSTGRPT